MLGPKQIVVPMENEFYPQVITFFVFDLSGVSRVNSMPCLLGASVIYIALEASPAIWILWNQD